MTAKGIEYFIKDIGSTVDLGINWIDRLSDFWHFYTVENIKK